MLLLALDPTVSTPAFRQICELVVARIEDGTLPPGSRLPPTRKLAQSLGVHRSTVVRAYEEIRALGYLESRSGAYSTVRRRARLPATAQESPERDDRGGIDWLEKSTSVVRALRSAALSGPHPEPTTETVDFERLAADPTLAPLDAVRSCLRSVLRRHGSRVLDYSDPAGFFPLREVLALRLRAHGISVGPEELLVTSGAQHGLDLVLRVLVRPGDRVVAEAPTYGMAHALFRLHGVAVSEVPLLEDGMDLDFLAGVLEDRRPKLVYTMPNFHNPTGITTDQAHRERLLELCEQYRVPLVEDGFEEEMKYFGKAVLPVKSMDAHGLVLYLGTFSKVVFPGLRVGWIAGDREAIALLSSVQHASCLAANTLAQAVADRFCRSGHLERYLGRIHRATRRRMQLLLAGLERNLPPGIDWTRPSGGYTLWLTLPQPATREEAIRARLSEAGVRVSAGRAFYGRPASRAHIRLSIACSSDDRIEEGCRRLGSVLTSILDSPDCG